MTVLKTICLEGELQLTAKDREKMIEEKRKRIVDLIHKGYVDPKTKKPYSAVQIESALTTMKAKIEMEKTAENQMKEILKQLILLLPLSKVEKMEQDFKEGNNSESEDPNKGKNKGKKKKK